MADRQQAQKAPAGPIVDDVRGTPNQQARHLIARRAFLEVFLDDERVDELLRGWADRSELDRLRSFVGIRIDMERVDSWYERHDPARRKGVDPRHVPGLLDMLPSPDASLTGQGSGPVERALQALADWSAQSTDESEVAWPDFTAEASQFATNLGLPYPWLVLALLREFGRRSWLLREPEGLSPRLSPFVSDEIALVPSRIRAALEKEAIWFYRSEVRREPLLSIAKSIFGDDKALKRRKDIRVGINAVRRLFDLSLDEDGRAPLDRA